MPMMLVRSWEVILCDGQDRERLNMAREGKGQAPDELKALP